jgi:hypothetical protein
MLLENLGSGSLGMRVYRGAPKEIWGRRLNFKIPGAFVAFW